MAIHQNRQVRGAGVAMKGYIKESLLPNCMDLVIWGHEHACEIEGGMYAVPESAEVRAPAHSLAALLGRAGESRPARTGRCSPAPKPSWRGAHAPRRVTGHLATWPEEFPRKHHVR